MDDACAIAWATLVRRADVDPDGNTNFGWLLTIATREAWRLASERTANRVDTPIEIPALTGAPSDLGAARPR